MARTVTANAGEKSDTERKDNQDNRGALVPISKPEDVIKDINTQKSLSTLRHLHVFPLKMGFHSFLVLF